MYVYDRKYVPFVFLSSTHMRFYELWQQRVALQKLAKERRMFLRSVSCV